VRSVDTCPRKRAQQARSIATVDGIIDAAARVLVSVGYDHASTKRIAKAAGISVGSLYQYFPTKEAVVAALLDRHIAQVFVLLERELGTLRDLDLPTAVRRGVRAFVLAQGADLELRRVFIEQVPRTGQLNRIGDIERRAVALLRAYLGSRGGVARPDLDLAATVIVRTIAHLTYDALVDSTGASHDAWIEEIAAMVLGYLGAQRS
jgi:AcrR family transcriptional regulator